MYIALAISRPITILAASARILLPSFLKSKIKTQIYTEWIITLDYHLDSSGIWEDSSLGADRCKSM